MAEKFQDNKELKKLFETLSAHEVRHGNSFVALKEKIKDSFGRYVAPEIVERIIVNP